MFSNRGKLTGIIKLLIVLVPVIYSQNTFANNKVEIEYLISSKLNKFLYEINSIKFVGNNSFSEVELQNIISSRITKRNTVHKIVGFYYEEFNKIENVNRYLPPGAMTTLKKALNRWSHEVQYFEEAKAEADNNSLVEFYTQNGFHDAKVRFEFKGDTVENLNTLTFYIEENDRYVLSEISYLGLVDVDDKTLKVINKYQKIKKMEFFSEEKIVTEVSNIQQILLNNGYYYSSYRIPTVTLDTKDKLDSLTIAFYPGKRQKISDIEFIDSSLGQKIVTDNIKEQQLHFEAGDWYSQEKVEASRQNLQALGTFELVNIDTNRSSQNFSDTTLPMKIFSRYRKQQEWGLGLYYNRTTFDNLDNGGIEGSYLNRNLGGIAQSLNLFTRFELKDISRLSESEKEWQLGITFAQPFLWKFNNTRVGISSQLLHTESRLNLFNLSSSDNLALQLSTTSFLVKFPTKLPRWTYFNGMSFDFLLEWQNPVNYLDAKESAMKDAGEDSVKINIINETFKTYTTLYNENKTASWIKPTAFIFSFSLSGDTRDELFSPTKGYYTNLSTDLWAGLGIAKYMRFQYSYNDFSSINKYTVFAFKVRAGYIYWWDKDNSYIPVERQFYAGGANSVRGWSSRRLRYYTNAILDIRNEQDLSFAQDFIGNRAILEGSFEIRWRFGKPKWASEIVANIINLGVMTGFVDWGNSFHWMAFNDEDYYTDMTFTDYLTGLGVSAGLGFGFQTPVGPLRFDFALPIYDPTPLKNLDKFVMNRYDFFAKNLQIHFGLGYAF